MTAARPTATPPDMAGQPVPGAAEALSPPARHLLMSLWGLSAAAVVTGSLLPAASPLMAEIGRLQVPDKLEHFTAYLILSALPAIGFRDRRTGRLAALSTFLLGLLLEAAQHFCPGRAVELGDVLANAAGVICGLTLAFPLRRTDG